MIIFLLDSHFSVIIFSTLYYINNIFIICYYLVYVLRI